MSKVDFMTNTEKAALERRIYDRCLVRVGQLEAEKAVLERRIDELCAEVERGKAEFKKMDVWHSQELKAAMDENAKLRELVRYMWDFSCVMPDEPHTSKEELDYSVEVWKRMRDVGIEVSE